LRLVLWITLLGAFLSASAQAAVFTVTSPFDASDANPSDGVCETAPGNGVCTLRAAIEETNALAGADTIILPPNTYLLTLVNELTITGDLTITGGGASTTIIDGNRSVRPASGVLVVSANAFIRVSITGVTIRNGGRTLGGGISNNRGLTLNNSTVSGNSGAFGGGIANNNGSLTLNNSTVSGNSAGDNGGGIDNGPLSTLTLINSTVSGNSGGGGGIYNSGDSRFIPGGEANLFNATITNNEAGSITGGGVSNGGTFNFQNTILAGNFTSRSGLRTSSNCGGTINSNGFNLMETTMFCTVNGGGVTVADPKLGPLQNNGGPTQTHALLAGSPALDGGDPGGCRDNSGALLQTDQRGFPRNVDGNNDGTATCDIGAVEGVGRAAVPLIDFDGDGKSDITVYRDGIWYVIHSSDGRQTSVGWGGAPKDVPLPADYDGDFKTDIAVYRDGAWFILRSSDGGQTTVGWGGLPQDLPVPADFDGDGKADIAVYRDGTWFIIRSSDGSQTTVGWGGGLADVPVPADYDGDGKADVAVYRDGHWFILRSSDGGQTEVDWGGAAQDIPVPADYDGDGKADLAVYRDGLWFILRSSDGVQTAVGWGLPQDKPMPGDYDGDGKTDQAVYRNGTWFILRSSDGDVRGTTWGGLPQDIPVK
jgi:CSLREA domain-containing protein